MLKLLIFISALLFFRSIEAFDPEYIANNKESVSKVLKKNHYELSQKWVDSQGGRSLALSKAKTFLASSLLLMSKRNAHCDLGFIPLLNEVGFKDNTLRNNTEILAVFAFLRIENQIDDLFFENVLSSQKLLKSMERRQNRRLPILNRNHQTEANLRDLYKEFKDWPDDSNFCSLGAYQRLSYSFPWKNSKVRNRILKKYNYAALEDKVISLRTYNKLETFRIEKALDWPVYLANYLDIVSNAKDKLSPSGNPEIDPAPHSTKYAIRKKKLTHREQLYKNFNSTQVMILAGIIEKTAKRMDSRNVSIHFYYNDEAESSEIYVLSPMEKYRLSLKMLRKDMAETMRSEIFSGKEITYEDLVTAAYETGYIKSEELDLILKFEEFWNPDIPKWKTYANFAFSLGGSATWFLPPPWNMVGALALIVTQTKVLQGKKPADSDDNWNVIL